MSDNILFEQAFYGSGLNGYQVLKNSAPQYDSIIERICGSVGTPDGFAKASPFLINYPFGDMTFWFCCVPGPLDRYKRKSLFFHVIYGKTSQLLNSDLNIFSIWRNNHFLSNVPAQCTRFSITSCKNLSPVKAAPFAWDKKTLAILSDAPQNELLEQLLGKDVNTCAWASFSFAPLRDFKIYAISKFASVPTDIACCDINGNIIQKTGEKTGRDKTVSSKNPSENESHANQKKSRLAVWILFVSIFVNIFLIYQQITFHPQVVEKEVIKKVVTPGPVQIVEKEVIKEVKVPAPVQYVEKTVQVPSPAIDKEAVKKEIIADLIKQFPVKYRIDDWDKELSRSGNFVLKDKASDPSASEYKLLQQLKFYVKFVNSNILYNKTHQGD